ncbi:MAG: LCP family protein [Candidatus Zipacnadales bacterium]
MPPRLARRHENHNSRASHFLDGLIYVLLFIVIGIGAIGVHDVLFEATGVKGQEQPLVHGMTAPFRPPFRGRNRVRLLLMGADKRSHLKDEGRSDTLMVLTLNPQTKRAALLGIPRDLKIYIPGHGRDKITHAYAYGGIELSRECVQELLGEPIHKHILLFFHGFVKVVDKLGGVWIDVPDIEGYGRGMNYDEGVRVMRSYIDHNGYLHCHLKPGFQKLDGAAALGFVRYRKSTMYPGAGDGDIQRSARQQQFLRAMAQQHLKITNIKRLLSAAGEMRQHITTDLSWDEIYDLLRVMKEIDTDALWSGTVPVSDSWEELYYAILQEDEFQEMKTEMERYLDGLPIAFGKVEVLNACGIGGRATDAAARLAEKGFPITATHNAKSFNLEETIIHYAPGHKFDAQVIANVLGCGQLEETNIEPLADEGTVDICVELGADYDPREAAVVAGELPSEPQQ